MQIRPEQPADRPAIHALNASAFDSAAEADLVDTLRVCAQPFLSLVADEDGEVVGHILFSPVSLSGFPGARIMGLAPMAVAPDRQGAGIGSALVREGLEQCGGLSCGAVVVLGHPDYYPRFGFRAASEFGIDCEYDVPEGVFMALELEPGYLRNRSGVIHYHDAFADA